MEPNHLNNEGFQDTRHLFFTTPCYGEGSFVVIRGRKEGGKWSKGLILILIIVNKNE